MESLRGEGAGTPRDPSAVVSRTREVADVSSRAFLEAFDPPRIYWAAPGGFEVAGVGTAARLTASGPERFDRLRSAANRLFSSVDADGPPVARPRAFGGVAFHENHEPTPPWEGFPAAEFVVPHVQIVRTNGRTFLTATRADGTDPDRTAADLSRITDTVSGLPAMRPSGGPPGISDRREMTSRKEWMAGVRKVLQRIEAEEIRKAVLATALSVELERDSAIPDVLERLRRTYPDCFRFLVEPETAGFFGAPPERLVRMEGRTVRTEALAGSVPRSEDPLEDDELANSLVESEKLQREQQMVVDAIRDQLAGLGEVRVGDQTVRKLATIQHLQTPIEARLDGEDHVLSLVEALHPTPAVGGLPPDRALETIRSIEPFDRGWYAAPIGWFDADGDGEFAVGIRSAAGNRRTVTLFAGNGIVEASDPRAEYDEVRLKFRPILDELQRDCDAERDRGRETVADVDCDR